MAMKLPPKDVVIIGLGWTGAILAQELTDQGLDVVAIERGPWRDTATSFNIGYAPDELRYGVRLDLFQRPVQSTLTFRNGERETALPIRQWGSFQPGNGVGGAGVHWGGKLGAICRAISGFAAISRNATARDSYRMSYRSRTGGSPTTRWSRFTTGSSISPASPARPVISTASFSRAATRSRGLAGASIRCRQWR